MSNLASVVRLLVVATFLSGLACGSKTVSTGKARNTNVARDGGRDGVTGGVNPDDRCMVFEGNDKREPGQACACASDCTTGNCQEGVCCSGEACGAKRPEGAPCAEASQCMSGFCADGVCCNVACTGACLSCNQPDMMGECTPVGAGVADPHGVCRVDAPETCGQSGVCNGQGGCAKYPADTVCKLGACEGPGQFVPPSTCDGEGTCIQGSAISCNPSTCEGGECVRICNSNSQCAAGKACVMNSCGKFGPGQSCTVNSDCDSNFCVDGVCCESECSGACQTCSHPMNRGKCVPSPAGASDSMCPVQAVSTCGTNGKCDGMGECAKYPDDTVCRSARCDSGANTATMAARCDDGVCPASETRSCAPFKGCSGNSCVGNCGADSQCTGGNVCVGGSCGKRDIGGKCTRDAECSSGNCSQGFCCNAKCDGVCKSCALAGRQGQCSNVPNGGADPGGRCTAGGGGCTNGCNGNGGCSRDPAGSTCGEPTCATGTSRTVHTCNASGACVGATAACPAATPTCRDGACVGPDKGPGEACTANGQCTTGRCVNNVCCNVASCPTCNVCGAGGNCAQVPDGRACGTGNHCQGGMCEPVCAPPTRQCPGATGCIDTSNNVNHCGGCGAKCQGPGTPTCSNGMCGCATGPMCGKQCCRAGQMCNPAGTACMNPPTTTTTRPPTTTTTTTRPPTTTTTTTRAPTTTTTTTRAPTTTTTTTRAPTTTTTRAPTTTTTRPDPPTTTTTRPDPPTTTTTRPDPPTTTTTRPDPPTTTTTRPDPPTTTTTRPDPPTTTTTRRTNPPTTVTTMERLRPAPGGLGLSD